MDKINIDIPTDVAYGIADLPFARKSVEFVPDSAAIFREQGKISPIRISDDVSIMPWGADNQMPFNIMDLIDSDETMVTCQQFNAEICYGSGLEYNTSNADETVARKVSAFKAHNAIPAYFMGCCQDVKYFSFCVSLIILDRAGNNIVRVERTPACYCRFAPADESGVIPYIAIANWRLSPSKRNIRKISLLSPDTPLWDLKVRLGREPGADGQRKVRTNERIFAVVSRVPTPDNTYYPIPPYASLFKGKWYNIKRLISTAKEAKLKNSAPIKYHIEVAQSYWERIARAEGITDKVKLRKRIIAEKQQMLDFLTGAENSGKVWFSQYYIDPKGNVQHDVVISKIDSSKEGGDWETDIQEAINMICFSMRVHSNLVGSVPGKAQSNNSGSDKRELFTIAHALQKPYHDVMFNVHYLICNFNGWTGVYPESPFMMLTTLDEHKDAKEVKTSNINNLP